MKPKSKNPFKIIRDEWKKALDASGKDWKSLITDFELMGKFIKNVFQRKNTEKDEKP